MTEAIEGPLGGEIDGVSVVRRYTTLANEVHAIRNSVALSEMPHLAVVRVGGESAYELLDRVVSGGLYVRDGQLLHTLLLREDGTPLADVYVGNDDGAYLVIADGMTAVALESHLASLVPAGAEVNIENVSRTHVMLELNGPYAWELLSAIEGPEVIGFPYLSFYRPDAERVYFRAGKTGEYGYDLLVPRASAKAVAQSIVDRGVAFDLAFAGTDALAHCALENWFFDIHSAGRKGLTPLELQLQWRLAPDKDYVGASAIRAHVKDGFRARITGIESDVLLSIGDAVTFEGATIGRIVEAEQSITRSAPIGITLLDLPYAHSGIDRFRARHDGADVALRTVSPPFVDNVSLLVNPQRHAYVDRAELRKPRARRASR